MIFHVPKNRIHKLYAEMEGETMGSNDLEKLVFDHPGRCDVCGGDLEYKGIGQYRCMA